MRHKELGGRLSVAMVTVMGLASVHADLEGVPGSATSALQLHDTPIQLMLDLPHDFTITTWVRTSNECDETAVFSYALPPNPNDSSEDILRKTNAFVLWNHQNPIICVDSEYLDLLPDEQASPPTPQSLKSAHPSQRDKTTHHQPPSASRSLHAPRKRTDAPSFFLWQCISCACQYQQNGVRASDSSLVSAEGQWKHLAATLSGGSATVHVDGVVVSRLDYSRQPEFEGGIFMIGGEMDCFGGCTQPSQSFRGSLDSVKIWSRALSHVEIIEQMRSEDGPSDPPVSDLIAFWPFDDPSRPGAQPHTARDASGNGHNLSLERVPHRFPTVMSGEDSGTTAVGFANGYALTPAFRGLPRQDVTVELWARTYAPIPASPRPDQNEDGGRRRVPGAGAALPSDFLLHHAASTLLSIATVVPGDDRSRGWMPDAAFEDDAVVIQQLWDERIGAPELRHAPPHLRSTVGAVRVAVNASRGAKGRSNSSFLDFPPDCLPHNDGRFHHVLASWAFETGRVSLAVDGRACAPFFRSFRGRTAAGDPVDDHISPRRFRQPEGALALGQDQGCLGGCFDDDRALHGDLARVRLWARLLSATDATDWAMHSATRDLSEAQREGLVAAYEFERSTESKVDDRLIPDLVGSNHLRLGGPRPLFVPAARWTAQSMSDDGATAFRLSRATTLLRPMMEGFPTSALTVSFWIATQTAACVQGAVLSFAVGPDRGPGDNALLIYHPARWTVAIAGDEGTLLDQRAELGSADGRFHNVALTWTAEEGVARFYDNGRLVWAAPRAKGTPLASATGALALFREQDCPGGCFEAHQDLVDGYIRDVRVFDRALPQDELLQWIRDDEATEIVRGLARGRDLARGLVAHWPLSASSLALEEGARLMRDVGPHRHDLFVLGDEPRFEPVEPLALCGNGAVEGIEFCDDGEEPIERLPACHLWSLSVGILARTQLRYCTCCKRSNLAHRDAGNERDGDGCSSDCHIERGWTCVGHPFSFCTRLRPGDIDPSPEAHRRLPWDVPRKHVLVAIAIALTLAASLGCVAAVLVILIRARRQNRHFLAYDPRAYQRLTPNGEDLGLLEGGPTTSSSSSAPGRLAIGRFTKRLTDWINRLFARRGLESLPPADMLLHATEGGGMVSARRALSSEDPPDLMRARMAGSTTAVELREAPGWNTGLDSSGDARPVDSLEAVSEYAPPDLSSHPHSRRG